MPEICRFLGILISINYDDHPPPHFHVRYGEYKATIGIRALRILKGRLPPRVLGLVVEWAMQHQAELLTDWNLARQQAMPNRIEPLE